MLLAWSKIALTDDLMATSVDTDGWALDALAEYFPPDLQARYGDRLGEHPLRKEIIVTMLANDIVNHGGITFVHRVRTAADEVAGTCGLNRRLDPADEILVPLRIADINVEDDKGRHGASDD